jgi:hypothetical protein
MRVVQYLLGAVAGLFNALASPRRSLIAADREIADVTLAAPVDDLPGCDSCGGNPLSCVRGNIVTAVRRQNLGTSQCVAIW